MPYLGVTPAAEFTSKDLNGEQLILDADADTTITADTDDQIDIRIAGADDFQMTANTFTVLSGSTLAVASGATIANSGTATGFLGTKLEASSDTSAGDNAAMGYTSAEGLILTGQGSTDDITIKNDADTTVLNVATGATDVEISAGNIVMGTGSKGIYLGVTSATAANLLDDYEEGTWTPGLTFGGSATGISYVAQSGTYTKIGRIVSLAFNLRIDDNGSSTGSANITGLPFTVENTAATEGYSLVTNYRQVFGAGKVPIGAAVKNTTTIYFYSLNEAGTAQGTLLDSDWGDTANIYASITYAAA